MEIRMNLTVSQRIWGGFIFITLLLLIIGGNSLIKIANIDRSTQKVNQLSLPALNKSAELQAEFILMSKAAQASFYTSSAEQLEPIKNQVLEQKQLFNTLHSELQEVVKNDPLLSKSSQQVETTYLSFLSTVEGLLADKAKQLALNKMLKAQLESIELAAEDANSIVLDIIDINGLEQSNPRAYQAAE